MSDKYELFLPEDFLKDEWFRSWVAAKDPDAAVYWTQWVKEHPDKYNDIFQARALFHALGTEHRTLTEQEIDDAIDHTVDNIIEQKQDRETKPPLYSGRWLRYAASILLVAGVFTFAMKYKSDGSQPVKFYSSVKQSVWLTETNIDRSPRTVLLPDGSRVVLKPEASLKYKKGLVGQERRTYLTGDAFFEVTRNPQRPFLVVTDKLITKVLGTSFLIQNDKKGKSSSVIVRTGKVSVFKREINKESGDVSGHVILTPNQSAVFSEKTKQLTKTLSDEPTFLHKIENKHFVYEDAMIAKVFDDLEAAYGVTILFDHELLRHCQITATLGEEPFYEKLELICLSIRASFRQQNGEIIIDSKGCNY